MADIEDDQHVSAWIFTWPQVKRFVNKAANFCNIIASFGVIFAVGFFIYGQKDRETQEEASAWSALANPKSGISLSRQIEYLSKDGWFRSASAFDDVYLVPEFGNGGVSLDGVRLKNSSLQNVKADRASLDSVEIDATDMSLMSLKGAEINNSRMDDVNLIKSDLSGSSIVNSKIFGYFTAASILKSIILNSELRIILPKVSVFNRDTLGYDDYYKLNMSNSFIRESVLSFPSDNRSRDCGVVELEAVELYYSKVDMLWESDQFSQKCRLFFDKSWIIGSDISGSMGWTCSKCTIAYSNMQIDVSLLVSMEKPMDGDIPMHVRIAGVDGSTVYRSKIFGDAEGLTFAGSKFLKADLSGLSFKGSDISGTEFDIYRSEEGSDEDRPDSFAMIFWRGYGESQRSLKDIDEFEFGRELEEVETPEQIRARYPAEGFKHAWAWRDRPPKGIPANVPGPILCDAKLRTGRDLGAFGGSQIPDECKPADWEEAESDEAISLP